MKETNELMNLYSWIDQSIRDNGFSHTLKEIKDNDTIDSIEITKPKRNIMMGYFKTLLDMPLPKDPEQPLLPNSLVSDFERI